MKTLACLSLTLAHRSLSLITTNTFFSLIFFSSSSFSNEEELVSLFLFLFLSLSVSAMDPAVIGALLAQLTAAGGGQLMSPPQGPPQPNPQQPNFSFGGANVSTEALLALFSQQANTAAALAALQSGSAAALPR